MEILRHTETTKYSEGRRIRVRKNHKSRGTRKNWKEKLNEHKDILFLSDINRENIEVKIKIQEEGQDQVKKKIKRKKGTKPKKGKIKINIKRGRRELFKEGRMEKIIWVLESEEVPWVEIEYEKQRRDFKPG